MDNDELKDMLMAMRGNPTRCDWCGEARDEDHLEPEEGGQSVCHDCIAKYETETGCYWANGQPKK